MTTDSQAQTLHYALGNLGGRRKSWMTGASALSPLPKHGGGKPSKQAPHSPNQHRAAQPPPNDPTLSFPEARLDKQPASSSISPQLANTVSPSHLVDNGSSGVTLFPSPTPSEENIAPPANLDFLPLGPSPANNAQHLTSGTSFIPNRPAEPPLQNTERPKPFGTLDLEQPTSHLQQLRRPSMPHIQTPTSPMPLTHHRRTSLGHYPTDQALSPSFQAMHSIHPQAPNTPYQGQAQALRGTLPPAPGAAHTPTQASTSPQQFNVPSSNWYTLQECLDVLNAFEATYPVVKDYRRDWRRLTVLKDAVERQDWSFLTMHQYYCLLCSNGSSVPHGLRSQPSLQTALRVMQEVLDSNNIVSPMLLRFFSNFPYPLGEIGAKWPAEFQHQGHLFLMFISQSPNYDPLKRMCERRRFPPLARELSVELRISSGTFQRLLFTAFFRAIWQNIPEYPSKSQFENEAVALFQQNQADYIRRGVLAAQTHSSGLQNNEQEKVLELRMWGAALKHLGNAFESSLRARDVSVTNQVAGVAQQPLHSPTYIQRQHPRPQYSASLVQGPVEMVSYPSVSENGRGGLVTTPISPTHLNSAQPRMAPPRAPAQQARPGAPLLPARGWIQPQQRQPNPARFSLHQAHLRSPVLRAKSAGCPLYHYVVGYVQHPARLLDAGRAVQMWKFTLSANEMQTIPKVIPSVKGGPEVRGIDDKSRTVRIRCIKWPRDKVPTDHAWAVADTAWIPYSYFTFNGTSLQQRKKVHNGKDLPIDVTSLLREGENALEVAVMAQSNDTSYLNYLVAVEVLGVISHDFIKRNCVTEKRMSAAQVMQGIKKKLSGDSTSDDDIAIVESNLTINLFDPFSASKMCDIPVRGAACLHNDCFDLETFLQTRRRKGGASVPDQWRCPICSADARPHHLFVDGFLEDVRKVLEREGLLHTRAIIVQQEGSWKPKAETRDANSVSDHEATNDALTSTVQSTSPTREEIIDLSD